MQAGIDHQANGAQHFVLQVAIVTVGVLIETDLLAEPFRVERQPSTNEV